MSSKYGRIFGVAILVLVSSLLDTGIWRSAHAATGTTTTMKLKDLPIGGVISLGAYNYVKIADNQFMQTEVAACPDGKTVAGKYVKCFEDSSAYTQTCTGSYYCNTSNTSWNSSTGKCDSSVTCPDGSTYCGSGTVWNSASSACVISAMQNWTDCYDLNINDTINLYDTYSGKTYTVKKFVDGNCYTYDDVSEGATYDDAKTLCGNIAGWSLPTKAQFDTLISKVGVTNMSSAWCDGQCLSDGRWWTATDFSSDGAYYLDIGFSSGDINQSSKNGTYRVRCIVN